MHANPCPFCAGEIAPATFAETLQLRAIYNRAPLVPGHCLIIPQRHVTTLSQLSSIEASALVPFAARIAELVMAVYGGTGVDLSLQQGQSAGQTVSHLHLHVIPRHEGDVMADWHSELLDSEHRPPLRSEDMAREVARLRRALAMWPERTSAPGIPGALE